MEIVFVKAISWYDYYICEIVRKLYYDYDIIMLLFSSIKHLTSMRRATMMCI